MDFRSSFQRCSRLLPSVRGVFQRRRCTSSRKLQLALLALDGLSIPRRRPQNGDRRGRVTSVLHSCMHSSLLSRQSFITPWETAILNFKKTKGPQDMMSALEGEGGLGKADIEREAA